MTSKSNLQTYFIKTFGCQMNYSDSERISRILENVSLKRVNNIDKADLIIYNSCSVRQSAEDRILGLKKNIQKLKSKVNKRYLKYKLPIAILTGCMCKRSWDNNQKREEKYLNNLKRKTPWVDKFIQIDDIYKIPEILGLKNKTVATNDYLTIQPNYQSKFSAYVPISTGCDEFCTYCIVPYTRGKLINRPSKEIIKDVRELIKKGYKDIMLLGQNVDAYQAPNKFNYKFLDLLKEIDNLKGDFWLSFLSSHPNYFSQKLADYFIKSTSKANESIRNNKPLTQGGHIRSYLHLALQSGSNKMLKLMNRKYNIDKFISLCQKLKENIPNLNLSTDIIVGFPNETKADFQKTINVFKKLEFDMAYINKYSPRKGTVAFKTTDNVPLSIKKKRDKLLTKILSKTALKNNQKYLDKEIRVLITKTNKKIAFGKSFNFKDVKINLNNINFIEIGDFYNVEIKEVNSWSLQGHLNPR